jgi:hypothetical protein
LNGFFGRFRISIVESRLWRTRAVAAASETIADASDGATDKADEVVEPVGLAGGDTSSSDSPIERPEGGFQSDM